MKKKHNSTPTDNTSSKSGALTQASSTRTPEARNAEIKMELDKYGLKPREQVEIKDPFTGQNKLVTLDRTGHTEQKLIVALADPNTTRDQKDHALSMYLWERGAESMSLITDLFRYKGEHTKESRVFQSRMQFDFQAFIQSFTDYLRNQSRLLGITLETDIKEEKSEFERWLALPNNKGKNYTYKDYCENNLGMRLSMDRMALTEMAIYALDEAESLQQAMQRIVQAREAQKGGGIYIAKPRPGQSNADRIYSVHDKELDEIIKADRELVAEAEKD